MSESVISRGFCQCGCGEQTALARATRPEFEQVKGQPVRFRRYHHLRVTPAEHEQRFWEAVDKSGPNGCWVWTRGRSSFGYGKVKRNGVTYVAHRVSWEMANGPIPVDLQVCHHCDNPPCVNPSHLFLGTQKDNLDDRNEKGRAVWSPGSRNGSAKLTEDQVLEILDRCKGGANQTGLAAEYGVSRSLVSMIVLRKIWTHV